MADVQNTLVPILIVPLVLIIIVAVFSATQDATVYTWENVITNESTGLTGTGAGTGTGSIASYMSPYQSDVIDTALTEFDRQAQAQKASQSAQALGIPGAFGGGREGVQLGEFDANALLKRAQAQAGLLQQGFQSAQDQALKQLQAQQGLGTYQTQLGQAGQAQQQAILDASQVAAKEAQYSPFTQLGLVGQQLAQIQPGAFPTQTVG